MKKEFRVYQNMTQFAVNVKAKNRIEAIKKARTLSTDKWDEYDHVEDNIVYEAIDFSTNPNRYKIRRRYGKQYFAEGAEYATFKEIQEQLINYHSIECSEESLERLSFEALLNTFGWVVYDLDGNPIEIIKT